MSLSSATRARRTNGGDERREAGPGVGSTSHATRSKSERARTGLTSQPSKLLSAICPNAWRSKGENSTRLRRIAASRVACASRLVASGPSAQSTITTSGLCGAFNASRPESRPSARSTSTPASMRRASIAGASNGELAMMRARVPLGTRRIVSEPPTARPRRIWATGRRRRRSTLHPDCRKASARRP